MALVHCYAGQEEKCRRRAAHVGKTISALNGEKWIDNTKGDIPIHNAISKHIDVMFRGES